MSESFKPGDVVVVKSSTDVRMTVRSVTPRQAVCIWFNGHDQLKEGVFDRDTLKQWVANK